MPIQEIGYDSGLEAAAKIIGNWDYLENRSLSVATYSAQTLGNLGGIALLQYTASSSRLQISLLIVVLERIWRSTNITLTAGETLYLDPTDGFNRDSGTEVLTFTSDGNVQLHLPYCLPLTKVEESGTANIEEGYTTITHSTYFWGKGYIAITVNSGAAYLVPGRETPTSFVVEASEPSNISWTRTGLGWRSDILAILEGGG